MVFNCFFLVVSIFLYAIAPDTYSFPFVVLYSIMFLLISIDLVKDNIKRGDYISFHLLFLFSFFLTTFALPLFVLSSQESYNAFAAISPVVFMYVDFNCITKASALCLVAICIYSIGVKIVKSSDSSLKVAYGFSKTPRGYVNPKYILIILTIAFLLSVYNMITTIGGNRDEMVLFTSNSFIYEIYSILLCLYLILNTQYHNAQKSGLKNFWRLNSYAIIEATIISLLFLNFGERGMFLTIAFILLGAISLFYKRIALKYILFLFSIGVFFMFAIRLFRQDVRSFSDANISAVTNRTSTTLQQNSMILAFSDLIGIGQELCVGYTIKERNGLQNPEFAFIVPFYAIPFAPSVVSQYFFGRDFQEMSNSGILNEYMSKYNSTFGNHCVTDIYMKWGVAGVCVLFFLFGYFVEKIEKRKYYSLLVSCFYIFLLSQALYLPRGSLLSVIRPLSEIWIILTILNFSKKRCEYKP